ncbi:MAG: hypothetical protein WD874_00775 [Parcubacteria group bacterium]
MKEYQEKPDGWVEDSAKAEAMADASQYNRGAAAGLRASASEIESGARQSADSAQHSADDARRRAESHDRTAEPQEKIAELVYDIKMIASHLADGVDNGYTLKDIETTKKNINKSLDELLEELRGLYN